MNYAKLTHLLKWILAISAVLDLVGLGSGFLEYRLLNDFSAGTLIGDAEKLAENSDKRQFWVGLTQMGFATAAIVLSLRWIYVSNRRVREIVADDLKFTPAWAIGWFFVPIANLWKPYQALLEIWRASTGREGWREFDSHPLLGVWWFMHLVCWMAGRAALRLSLKAETLPETIQASRWMMASDALDFFGTWIFFFIVHLISTNIAARERGDPPGKERWE